MPKSKTNTTNSTAASSKKSVDVLLQESISVRDLLSGMAKNIVPKSEWYIISKNWIDKWQVHVGFDDNSTPDPSAHPGKVDSSDII